MEEFLKKLQISDNAMKLYLQSVGRKPLSSFELYSILPNISQEEYAYYKGLANLIAYRQTEKKDESFIIAAEKELVKAQAVQGGGDLKIRINLYLSAINLLEKDDLPGPVKAALLLRQQGSKSSTAKLDKINNMVSADSRVRNRCPGKHRNRHRYVYPVRWASRGSPPITRYCPTLYAAPGDPRRRWR